MEKYKDGTVIELGKNKELYIVLGSSKLEKDNGEYILVAPISENSENGEIDSSKMVVLKVFQDDQLELIKDKEIVREVLETI